MIKKVSCTKLNGKIDFSQCFHQDINVITGRNGSGKTTLLKLIWYMMSGNIERIHAEIPIEEAELETDRFKLSLAYAQKEGRVKIAIQSEVVELNESVEINIRNDEGALNRINRLTAAASGASLFFPTFRRIEGGFSMTRNRQDDENGRINREAQRVEDALQSLSERLSVLEHRLIASISTNDIITTLTKRYADISESVQADNDSRSKNIIKIIQEYDRTKHSAANDSSKLDVASKILEEVQTIIAAHSERQEALLKPFSVLSALVADLFQHKGIRLTSRITLGEASMAIASDKLSAGEKQMLSFLAYNTFARNSIVFIDEPEISLHVDWQRILFPTLLSQNASNQFIIATHSPFIYSKYTDKELLLDTRGEGE
ncbi:ATP-binding protein [Myxococcus sp. CA051A]|uniref:AAA family ATPase n=1 Tax=Myxococcus sp. CA051A TaxID=2741739 RepID=UPI00157AABD4|nr:ATP-binding protein [Myxococcus sp. CA051A]NTX67021.1 ATP-binding protein [Myxococcus sp. CA051A]